MESDKYFEKNSNYKHRFLKDGCHDERNAHNFLKSCLLTSYTIKGSEFLDLGCGKGGDISKIKHLNVKHYTGIDSSQSSLEVCKERITKTNIPHTFSCDTLWTEHGFGNSVFDTVSCQFAFHYSFNDKETAIKSILNVKNCLKTGGIFMGIMPVCNKSYEKRPFKILGYAEEFMEPTVTIEEFERVMNDHFSKILVDNITDYYNSSKHEHKNLLIRMNASKSKPKSNYIVFVYKKS